MMARVARPSPLKEALQCSQRQRSAVKHPVQCPLDKLGRYRNQIEECPSTAGDGNGAEARALGRVEPARPPNEHT